MRTIVVLVSSLLALSARAAPPRSCPAGSARHQLAAFQRRPLAITPTDRHLFFEGTWDDAYRKLGAHPDMIEGLKPKKTRTVCTKKINPARREACRIKGHGRRIRGTRFAVFAPYTEKARVMVQKLDKEGQVASTRTYSMKRDASGIWTRFIPGVKKGDVYEYVFEKTGEPTQYKADPYALDSHSSKPPGEDYLQPGRQSRVFNDSYRWRDSRWMKQRQKINWDEGHPLNILELHPGLVRDKDGRFLNWQEVMKKAVKWARKRGNNYIELMAVANHPLDESMGYQVGNFFAPNSRHGSPRDLKAAIDHAHQNGIGVILDWVPAHFLRDAFGLHNFGHGHLYSSGDPRKRVFDNWGTDKFDFEPRGDTHRSNWSFMRSNLMRWVRDFHVDGIRQDAVAAMIYMDYDGGVRAGLRHRSGDQRDLDAIAFMKSTNRMIKRRFPGLLLKAEESSGYGGVTDKGENGLGFDRVWSLGWMHDTFNFLKTRPVDRKHSFWDSRRYFTYWNANRTVLPVSHDEFISGKDLSKLAGDDPWQRWAQNRIAAGVQFLAPGGKLNWIGAQFRANGWDKNGPLDWSPLRSARGRQLLRWHGTLGHLYQRSPALWRFTRSQNSGGNEHYAWTGADPEKCIDVSYRQSGDQTLAVVVNYGTPARPAPYRIGLPRPGEWRIAKVKVNGRPRPVNSDDRLYGGSGFKLRDSLTAEPVPYQNEQYSADIAVPPAGVVVYEHVPGAPR